MPATLPYGGPSWPCASKGAGAGTHPRMADDVADPTPAEAAPELDEARLEHKRAAEEQRLEQLQDAEGAEGDQMGRQRRQNVRIEVQYPITLLLAGRQTTGRTRDMSATGVGFSTRLPVEMDEAGEVTIDFPEWQFTKPFVIRFMRPILAGCQVGAQFVDLTEDERERLVKEVFDVQRAQLQSRR